MIEFTLNGSPRQLDVDPDMPLLWALRDILGLTGTKYSCGIAQCGACMVHLDGEAVPSCVTPVSAVQGREVITIEGLDSPEADAVRTAWKELEVVQCGYCQPGQIMAATGLLRGNPDPTDADIDAVMATNLCRCSTYARIRAAIHQAADRLGQGEGRA